MCRISRGENIGTRVLLHAMQMLLIEKVEWKRLLHKHKYWFETAKVQRHKITMDKNETRRLAMNNFTFINTLN